MLDPNQLIHLPSLSGALIALRIFSAGIAWLWIWPASFISPPQAWRQQLLAGATAAITGLIFLLLPLAALSAWGHMSPWTFNALSILVPVIGTLLGLGFRSPELRGRVAAALPAAMAGMILFTVVLHLPDRGENILGGQDPGVYPSQGMHLLATGGKETPEPLFEALQPEEREIFVEESFGFRSLFPGVSMRGDAISGPGYFFSLTPVWIAFCGNDAGLTGAVRSAHLTALLSLLLMAAMIAANRGSGILVLAATALLASQPVWIYQWDVPTSEMLDLCLMLAIGLVLDYRNTSHSIRLLMGLLFMAAVLNRLAFLPFGGCLMALCAWRDLGDPNRKAVFFSRAAQGLGLAAGALHNWHHHFEAIQRLGHTPSILWVLCVLLGAGALILDFGAHPFARLRKVGVRTIAAFILCAIALYLVGYPASRAIFRISASGGFAYIGWAATALALLGGIVFFFRPHQLPGSLPTYSLFLFAAMLALLSRSEIAAQFPYAARRTLSYAVPWVALMGGLFISWVWTWRERAALPWPSRWIAFVVLSAVVGLQSPKAYHAWTASPGRGIGKALAQIAEKIQPEDVVFCDHFAWATPLRMIFQRPVYCPGEDWFRKPEASQKMLEVAQKLQSIGKRVLILTSTHDGPAVFPAQPKVEAAPQIRIASSSRTLINSVRARDFIVRTRAKEFTLYSLHKEP